MKEYHISLFTTWDTTVMAENEEEAMDIAFDEVHGYPHIDWECSECYTLDDEELDKGIWKG